MRSVCVFGGVLAGERESCGDTSTLERWEQVGGRVGRELDRWREEEGEQG